MVERVEKLRDDTRDRKDRLVLISNLLQRE